MKKKTNTKTDVSKKNGRGRPPVKAFPDPIPDSMKNIARAVLTTPPKNEQDWKYLKDHV